MNEFIHKNWLFLDIINYLNYVYCDLCVVNAHSETELLQKVILLLYFAKILAELGEKNMLLPHYNAISEMRMNEGKVNLF